jgi:parvulin-like peptidyl-prolyl isomerase
MGAEPEADPFPTDPEAVVATVAGTEITAGEVGAEARRMISLQTGGRMPPEQLAAFEPSVRPAALQGMIDAVLLDEATAEAGIEVSPEDLRVELERNLDAFLLDSGMSREDLDQRVQATEGMTLEQMLTEQAQDPEPLRRMGHAELVRQRYPAETEVTDEQVVAAYEEQKETAFSKPATVRASHVLVEDRERAEELAELARTADVAFAELARENSTCSSAEQGGDLGFFQREGQMVEPFAAAAFELEPGEISDVVETQFGFHVIQVTERKPATVVSLEEAAPMLRTQLELRRVQEQLDPLMAELRSGAEIDYAEGLEPEEPAALPGGAGAQQDAGHGDHAGHDH